MTNSIIKQFEYIFRESWEKPAMTDLETGFTLTYGEIARRIRYTHFIFEELNIAPGDKVAICARNCTNWGVAMLAVITYRAVAVPLLSEYSDKQLVDLCKHCEAKFMIGDNRLENLWADGECPMYLLNIADLLPIKPSLKTDTIEKRAIIRYMEEYPDGYSANDVLYEDNTPDDMMLLSYTSGSTGNPKGVMLSCRAMLSNLEFGKEKIVGNRHLENMLIVLPMAHMFGFLFDFILCMAHGAHANVLLKPPAPQILMNALCKVKPDVFSCVPLVMEKMIKRLSESATDGISRDMLLSAMGGKLYEVIMGGAALSKETESLLRTLQFPYTIAYGMTECGPIITFADYHIAREGSCGVAAPRMTIKVLSEDPENTPGEVVTRGDNLMMGYYKNLEATSEAIDADGWLHTGDYGIIDKDGYLYLRGRKKNMLVGPNGQNIYPEEAEDQVVSHSVFDECVVVSRSGKLVGLVYASDSTLKRCGMTRETLDLEAIRKDVNTHLPSYCQLSKLEQRSEEFAKTPKKSIRRFLYK